MPYDEAEADDPMMLVAVPAPDDPALLYDMAEGIVDEYVRMGMSGEDVLRLFREPFFAMTHGIYRSWGEARVQALIDETRARYRPIADTCASRRAGACPPPPIEE